VLTDLPDPDKNPSWAFSGKGVSVLSLYDFWKVRDSILFLASSFSNNSLKACSTASSDPGLSPWSA